MDHDLFDRLLGEWQGTCKAWSAGKLLDDAVIRGRFEPLLEGRMVRHCYTRARDGKTSAGEETIAFDRVAGDLQLVWWDAFHMSNALMVSRGKPARDGFAVTGSYRMHAAQEPWGWRTEYAFAADDRLTISAFNIAPDGREELAVETAYERVTHEEDR